MALAHHAALIHTHGMFRFALFLIVTMSAAAAEHTLHSFQRQTLSTEYYCEGAGLGDVSRDGRLDVVAGPYWCEGPSFEVQHEIYQPQQQNRNRYADIFFSFVYY